MFSKFCCFVSKVCNKNRICQSTSADYGIRVIDLVNIQKGFIDRIEQTPEGEYVVVDFKTGLKPSSLTKNSVLSDIQLNLYSLAIKEMFGKLPRRVSFYYLKENTMVDYLPTEESVGAYAETTRSIISAVCAEQFDPTPSYQTCRFCDYADLCGTKEAGGE